MQSLEHPEYTEQVQELVERGFTDRTANLDALIATQGNVSAAAAKLLQELPNFIGEGRSGKVFFPALPCKDNRTIPSNYVSKLVTKENAEKEILESEKIKKYLPDDALYVLDACESSVKDKMYGLWRDTLVFSKYGGQNITFLNELNNLFYRPKWTEQQLEQQLEKLPEYKKVLASLIYLRERVNEMNKMGFFHNDIQYDNIVYNEEEEKSYLIDFESAGTQGRGPSDIKIMDEIISEINRSINVVEGHLKSSHLVGRGRKKSRNTKKGRKKRKTIKKKTGKKK